MYAAAVQDLIDELGRLPGVGPKSAQRIAFHLLKLSSEDALGWRRPSRGQGRGSRGAGAASTSPRAAASEVRSATSAWTTAGTPRRSASSRSPATSSRSRRPTSSGAATTSSRAPSAPSTGVGPDQLRIRELLGPLDDEEITEVILCTNPNIEGDATAMYLASLLKAAAGQGDPHRQRPAGRRRPGVRRRADPRPGPGRPRGPWTSLRPRLGRHPPRPDAARPGSRPGPRP